MRRLEWIVRQLLPLTYRSHYRDAEGRQRFAVWRMWLGRCFAVEDFEVAR